MSHFPERQVPVDTFELEPLREESALSAAELELDPGSVEERLHVRLKRFTLAAALATHVLLVVWVWGQWKTIALSTAVFVLSTAVNALLARRFFSKRARTTETFRLVFNQAVTLTYGLLTDWALPIWLYLPLDSLWVDEHLGKLTRYLLFSLLLLVGGIAVLDGCPPLVPAVFLVLSALAYAISGARVHLQRHALEGLSRRHQELTRAHDELAQAHQRAREQDRLSSLGLLAAGIAHEINNPLSYIKSNINLLHKDLKSQPGLTPELEEYVTDVLPATLEGVQRIASIVSDLRYFARGGPEPMVEYDLNAEVEAALRITHGQFHSHCDMNVLLGTVSPMVGRPRQISQVVINLLINAAQAVPPGGKVEVRTYQEGTEAVLVVKDNGVGMGPDIIDKLFQPFFSTKPLGKGTGMGLAVVHGIVSAHGGRIQVESQVRRGSTFTIHLPREPSPPHMGPSPI
ncbi:sensor histidine kinase [Hyalangium rubrum]|uniref:histidine kinase n=1 Tax=Hyalangium rubrum TaxID=3103134 RepID=A0ABU5HEU1_9BACT|nr:ATP-binding protein [Hyalangium sp. s54d21]MDY7231766.1 ATP-binding protein [Hyalangium sp. s54d21]